MDPWGGAREQYQAFAEHAVDSPCFVDWSRRVADDEEVLAWLDGLPAVKQQPNLVFAAARWHGAPAPGPYEGFRHVLLEDGGIRATILSRATQTNEAGRMATLVPALGQIGGEIALIEVGASGGLCLHPDRWDYDWSPLGELRGSGGPTLVSVPLAPFPVPTRHPDVRWRAGADLNPLDVTTDDAAAWLTNLVWPEQDDRRELLQQAIAVARAEPPEIRRGDLFDLLPGLLADAGRWGVPVVQHTAVIAYLPHERRRDFDEMMRALVAEGACRWISNEDPDVLPEVARAAPERRSDRFVLGIDGHAVAWTHGHGRDFTWFGAGTVG
ncbi:DUF2332 domain-containing protein [Nocardioides alcanivorans]|uniref:DUF2332 domain-containing protein n=1 Tax=Nocardioides alcanivorans TaxID=2897352 RepID=UPI001F3C4B15|nr:DUF2332 domain-containing protein [Nocardioides alcanivorans]